MLFRSWKAWCGLKEAGRLARGGLRGLLYKHGYRKTETIGYYIRETRGISFALAAGGFGAKYKGKAGAGHLANALPAVCKATPGWEGKRYNGASLGWGYEAPAARCSMPGCAKAALEELKRERPAQQQHAPPKIGHHRGEGQQAPRSGGSRLLAKKEITFIQLATGKFLYCAQAAGSAMLRALSGIATKTANGTTETMDAIKFFMGYASWHPGASVLFRASGMILRTVLITRVRAHQPAQILQGPSADARLKALQPRQD